MEVSKYEFKAKEPTVLKKEPFWPELESRVIPEGTAPGLATEDRAEDRKKYDLRKKADEERHKVMEEELKKVST